MTLLELHGVTKIFSHGMGKTTVAVDNVSLEVGEEEIVSLLGESGSGKTTIARMVLRLLKPTRGRILYMGKDVWRLRGREARWYYTQVQGVFQDPYSSFNPIHVVERPLLQTLSRLKGVRGEEAIRRIREVLRRVGLSPGEVLGKYPHQLSGGQLQRVSIARALLVEPRLLVADEPVSMLDASTRIDVLNIFAEMRDELGTSVLLIGHDVSLAYYISDRVVILYRGGVMEEGDASKVLDEPAHPYTRMLLDSIPRLGSKWRGKLRLHEPPRGGRGREGCLFADRCELRFSQCLERPELVRYNRRRVACWLYK